MIFGRGLVVGVVFVAVRFMFALHLARVLCPFIAGQGADHHVDAFADELRGKIRVAVRRDVFEEFLDDLKVAPG